MLPKEPMVLNIGSWNVRGLGTPAKRAAVFDMLDIFKIRIACLQETHLNQDTKSQIRNKRFQCQFHSVHTTYSRGVSVLIERGVAFTCRQCKIDVEGRYIFLYCVIENQEYVLANIYIPPPFKLDVLYCLLEFIMDKTSIPIIVVGDFNVVINKKIDRLPPGNQGQGLQGNRMSHFLCEAGLLDLWRIRNPVTLQFSCYSGSYSTLSRIDLVLANELGSQIIKDIIYQPRGVSDHSLLMVSISINNNMFRRVWKMNPIWFGIIEDQNGIIAKLNEFISFNADTTTRGIMWDALKAYLRGLLIQQISRIKKSSLNWEDKTRKELITAEREYVKEPTPGNQSIW